MNKTQRVELRLSEDELSTLKKTAGGNVSSWIREHVKARPNDLSADEAQILRAFRRTRDKEHWERILELQQQHETSERVPSV